MRVQRQSILGSVKVPGGGQGVRIIVIKAKGTDLRSLNSEDRYHVGGSHV